LGHGRPERAGEWGEIAERVPVGEYLCVPGGQRVAPLLGVLGGVVDRQEFGHGLLLQPLPGVSGMGAGCFGQAGGSETADLGKCPVVPEAVTEIDGGDVKQTE